MPEKKIKIAVTGGIGSGKSEFCKYLSSKGYPVISADYEAKQILASDTAVKNQIIQSFGKEAFTAEGPNTKYLAEKVFSDPEKVRKINSIIHPRVIKKINALMNNSLQKNNIVFVEAALIYEAAMEEMFDYVVLITASEAAKISRIIQRDNSTEEAVRKRMENQISDDIKETHADFTFKNDADLNQLFAKADFLITIVKTMSGVK
ncbi:MAG: dephospho-CoA kinase [Bacillota bacterium]